MAASKMNAADAQEWLESLQQVGEGWYRQVALAVRAGAHKALGMERREFAQQIGQRMIDPRPAVIELYDEGHTTNAIADVLGMGRATVHNILVEAGKIEGELRRTGSSPAFGQKKLAAGNTGKDENRAAGNTVSDLQERIENLEAQVKGERTKAKDAVEEVKQQMRDLRKEITEERRRLKSEADLKLTAAERERAAKEADAWAEEQGRKVLAGFAILAVDHIVGALEEATGDVRLLIEQDAVDAKTLKRIETAHAGFQDELNVARMTVSTR